ncbi:TadE family protein [Tessaracoccus lubricantis]
MRHAHDDRGAAAVEFAIVSMLLVTLLLGIMEFGYAFFVQGNIAGAARESARVYAIGRDSAKAKQAAVDAGAPIGITEAMVGIPSGSCPATPPSGSIPAVTVTITYPYKGITGFFFDSLSLEGRGTMRCNG